MSDCWSRDVTHAPHNESMRSTSGIHSDNSRCQCTRLTVVQIDQMVVRKVSVPSQNLRKTGRDVPNGWPILGLTSSTYKCTNLVKTEWYMLGHVWMPMRCVQKQSSIQCSSQSRGRLCEEPTWMSQKMLCNVLLGKPARSLTCFLLVEKNKSEHHFPKPSHFWAS